VRGKAPRAKVEYHDGVDVKAAAAFAKASEIAIVFVNEPTTEGRDLPSLNLSGAQNDLVSAVAAANPRTIVVLETGGPAAMPWTFSVGAAIEIWYLGHQGGRGAREHPVRRREPTGHAAGHVRKV
jgi:beta-glucosidase